MVPESCGYVYFMFSIASFCRTKRLYRMSPFCLTSDWKQSSGLWVSKVVLWNLSGSNWPGPGLKTLGKVGGGAWGRTTQRLQRETISQWAKGGGSHFLCLPEHLGRSQTEGRKGRKWCLPSQDSLACMWDQWVSTRVGLILPTGQFQTQWGCGAECVKLVWTELLRTG